MPPEVTVRRRIQWFDTDASTKYHNTAPLRLMEEAEAALLDQLGIIKEVYGKMPRAHVSIDYRRPLRFWDQVDVHLRIEEVGRTSITYRFEIRDEAQAYAEGKVVAVYISEAGEPTPWPERYKSLLDGSAGS